MENLIRIQAKVDTAERWATNNPILLDKEIGYVRESGQYKIGDGIHTWNDLPFAISSGTTEKETIFHTVENEDDRVALRSVIPADKEYHIIMYKNVPYFDGEGNKLETAHPLYVTKIGDGVHNLSELLPLQNLTSGNSEEEGTTIQFLESELYEIANSGVNTTRSTVTGKGSVAFGRYNTVHGRESFATNYNNTVNGKWSAAFNQNNTIEAADSSIGKKSENLFVAGGTNNKISGDQGAVLGSANKSNGTHYVILGDNNTLGDSANFVRVLGKGLNSNAVEQILIGTFNAEDNNARVIIASGDSTSNPRNSIVIKKDGGIEIDGGITHNGNITGSSTIIAKTLKSNNATIDNTITAGSIRTAGSSTVGTSIAVGSNTVTSGTSAAFGSGNTVSISHGFAAGEGNEVSGENAYAAAAFGRATKAHGLYSFVEGVSSKTEAAGSHVEGYSCKSNPKATGSHVGGSGSEASTPYAFVHGLKLKTIESDNGTNSPAVFGRYNEVDGHALFSVGNGTSDTDRKNAFTVNDDNSITIGDVNLTADELNNMKSGLSEFEEYKTDITSSITNLENNFDDWTQGQNLPYKYGTSTPTTDQLQPYQLYFQYA